MTRNIQRLATVLIQIVVASSVYASGDPHELIVPESADVEQHFSKGLSKALRYAQGPYHVIEVNFDALGIWPSVAPMSETDVDPTAADGSVAVLQTTPFQASSEITADMQDGIVLRTVNDRVNDLSHLREGGFVCWIGHIVDPESDDLSNLVVMTIVSRASGHRMFQTTFNLPEAAYRIVPLAEDDEDVESALHLYSWWIETRPSMGT